MISRDQGSGYQPACQHAPPPLNVYDSDAEQARWHPLPRPHGMRPHHPGPVMVTVPQNDCDLFGDDPTDPARQFTARVPTAGMVGRLNIVIGNRNVRPRSERR